MNDQTILFQNILSGEAYDYAGNLMDDLSLRFGVLTPKRHNFEPHFTLKYKFITDQLIETEKLLGNYLKDIEKAPVNIGGFGTFKDGDVVYLKVNLSDEARELFRGFYKFLESMPKIVWSENDKENLSFHVTLGVSCKDKAVEIMEYLQKKEKLFGSYLDNVTLLKCLKDKDGNDIWKKHKQFHLS